MKELGADIAKIAVMPRSARDVLTLLSATEKMKHQENPIPIITVSMSAEGLISRISGEIFGSAVTFASAGRSSAPGQISADQADRLLLTIHRGSDESRIKGRPCEGKKNVILIGVYGYREVYGSQKDFKENRYESKRNGRYDRKAGKNVCQGYL